MCGWLFTRVWSEQPPLPKLLLSSSVFISCVLSSADYKVLVKALLDPAIPL